MKTTTKPETPQPVRVQRVVGAQMKIYNDGTASFHVRGYDFRYADLPISVNGCMFSPVLPNARKPARSKTEKRKGGSAPCRVRKCKARVVSAGLCLKHFMRLMDEVQKRTAKSKLHFP